MSTRRELHQHIEDALLTWLAQRHYDPSASQLFWWMNTAWQPPLLLTPVVVPLREFGAVTWPSSSIEKDRWRPWLIGVSSRVPSANEQRHGTSNLLTVLDHLFNGAHEDHWLPRRLSREWQFWTGFD